MTSPDAPPSAVPPSAPRPSAAHLQLGAAGEDAAVAALERAGVAVVSRNWRCEVAGAKGELDVVGRTEAHGRDVVVVCEVKTRTSDAFGSPASAVGRVKAARLRRLAVAWLAEHALREPWTRHADVRFDVVAVTAVPGRAMTVEHLRDVL